MSDNEEMIDFHKPKLIVATGTSFAKFFTSIEAILILLYSNVVAPVSIRIILPSFNIATNITASLDPSG